VVPTMIGNAYFLPRHLLTPKEAEDIEAASDLDEMPNLTRRSAPSDR